jgi:hypothetical protein
MTILLGCVLPICILVLFPLAWLEEGGSRRWLAPVTLCAFLMAYGIFAFFGQAGGLWFLGDSAEWPVLGTEDAVENARGEQFVPLVASGRIQVYDREGKFLRGWSVPTSGGAFKLHATKEGNLDVFMARGDRHLVFAADGTLLSDGHYRGEDYDRLPAGPSCRVEHSAAWYLWPLTNPALAMLPGVVGLLGLGLLFNNDKLHHARFRDPKTLGGRVASRVTLRERANSAASSSCRDTAITGVSPERVRATEKIAAGVIMSAAGLMVIADGVLRVHAMGLAMTGALLLIVGLILLTVGEFALRRTRESPSSWCRGRTFVAVGDAAQQLPSGKVDVDELKDCPWGTWFEQDAHGFSVGASTRSAAALILVPFITVWSWAGLGGLYVSQIVEREFHPILSLFGLPFVAAGAYFWMLALMWMFGKTVVTVKDNAGTLFVGIGTVGWRRSFDWRNVDFIRKEASRWGRGLRTRIALDGPDLHLKFGTDISEKRKDYMLRILKRLKKTQNRPPSRAPEDSQLH